MPDHVDAQLRAGVLLLFAKEYPDARERALRVLAKEPRNPRALVLLGNSLAGLKDLDAAIEQVEQAIDADPQITLSYANLGALQMAKGDLEAAEDAFRRAVEAAPQSAQAHGSLANFLWAAGMLDEAESEFRAALGIEPTSPEMNRAMAAFYASRNRASEAEPYLKTYAQESGTVEAKLLLADYYSRARKLAEATSILSSLAGEDGGFVPATLRLASLDFIAGRRPEAYTRLEAILQREPRNEPALEAKARFLLYERKNQEALSVANGLVEINPRLARGQYVRGLALESTGSSDEAVKAFQEVLSTTPSSVPAQASWLPCIWTAANYRDALLLSQQVVKAQPQSAEARFLYAKALLKTGDLLRPPNASCSGS